MITSWEDVQARGLTLYADAHGRLHMRPNKQPLSPADQADLKTYRAPIAAAWLWECDPLPPILAWDTAIAEAVMTKAVHWVRGAAFPPDADWKPFNHVEAILGQAWKDQNLCDFILAARVWIAAIAHLWQPDALMPTLLARLAEATHPNLDSSQAG